MVAMTFLLRRVVVPVIRTRQATRGFGSRAGAHPLDPSSSNWDTRRAISRPDTDQQVVNRAREGDVAAFEELIRLHSAQIYRALVRMLGNSADAEEVAQEAFLKAWKGLAGFRGDALFSTWLFRIAINEGNRRLARDARRPTLPIDNVMAEATDLAEGPAALAESAELEAYLERCVVELPAQYRAAVVLRDVEGLTNGEAADALGLNVRNFKSRLHRGRMVIRRRLEEFYETEAATAPKSGLLRRRPKR